MKSLVILYKAYIPYVTNGVDIVKHEFVETNKQFKSTGDNPFVILKDRMGRPQKGYARTPEAAVEELRLSLDREANHYQGLLSQVYNKMNILGDIPKS